LIGIDFYPIRTPAPKFATEPEAACRDPKPLIGYSDITILHLALWRQCRLAGFHGPYVGWERDYYGDNATNQLRRSLMDPEPITIRQDPREITAKVVIEGTAKGILMGGNLSMLGRAVGWACPSFEGAILLIEAGDTFIGQIEGTLTQLRRSGCLDGLRGVAAGPIHPLGRAKGRKVVGD